MFCVKAVLGAEAKSVSNVFPNPTVFTSTNDTTLNIDETRNRFPEILRDAKLLMSEVIISDFNKDTLEVAFLLSKIFELLMEADQIGEMNLEDKEEFDRFNRTFTDMYTHKLNTVQNINAPIMAEKIWTDISEAIEIEMGETKFTVVDDRDGHLPLVRTKQVDQYINYFQKNRTLMSCLIPIAVIPDKLYYLISLMTKVFYLELIAI